MDWQKPAARVLWRTEEPPVARDPEEIDETLRQLARLDPVEFGQQAVLERIVQAAATCCDSTGGVGLLLLNHDEKLRYVAAAGRARRSLAGSQVRLGEGPSVDAFLQDAPVASRDLAGEPRWPDSSTLGAGGGHPGMAERTGAPASWPDRRARLRLYRPASVAAPGPRGRQCLRAADQATLQLATAHQQEALSPALRFCGGT